MRHDGQRIFRVIFDCVRTCYHSFRLHFLSDFHITNTKWSLNAYIYFSMFFSKIRLGGNSFHMKPMPVIFLFSDAHESLSNMWNLDCNPCLVRKQANVMKYYNISVPRPVLHWIGWYLDTFKIIENKYLPLDFVIKYW